MSVVDKPTLLDVPAYSMAEVDAIASVLVDRLVRNGFDKLGKGEQMALRLLRTLLDGFAP